MEGLHCSFVTLVSETTSDLIVEQEMDKNKQQKNLLKDDEETKSEDR